MEAKASIGVLLRLAERELGDSQAEGVSLDGRYEHAYSAARAMAEAAMTAEGYRPAGGAGQHQVVFEFIRLIPTANWQSEAIYFDACRQRRNRAMYRAPGLIGETELAHLIAEATRFSGAMTTWLRHRYPQLAP